MSSCQPCAEPARPVDAVTVAVIVVLAVVLICFLARKLGVRHRDGFVSQRAHEIYQSARELFERTRGAATYSMFKGSVPDADPVTYADTRDLWRKQRLTAEAVQAML